MFADLRWLILIRHECGHLHVRFDSTEARSNIREPAAVYEADRSVEIAVDLEGHNAAIALHQTLCHGMVGMAFEARIMDAAYLRMLLEETRDRERVSVVGAPSAIRASSCRAATDRHRSAR